MTNKPASSLGVGQPKGWISRLAKTYIKPAPPVIMIFLTSGKDSNLVEPMRMGACFQIPWSSKNLGLVYLPVGAIYTR